MYSRLSLVCLLAATLFAAPVFAQWRPVSPGDLALKQSRVDPNADAEALFREIRISNEQKGVSYPRNIITEYVRIKIFTARDKELGNVQLPYYRSEIISDVQGRTIHPDGSIVELNKDSVFNKVLEKRGYKTKVVTFAMPAVEVGSIIEYRYHKNEGERTNRYQPVDVQTDYPVDEVTLFIKPLSNIYVNYPTMRYLPFGCKPEREPATADGFDVLKITNVPAFHVFASTVQRQGMDIDLLRRQLKIGQGSVLDLAWQGAVQRIQSSDQGEWRAQGPSGTDSRWCNHRRR